MKPLASDLAKVGFKYLGVPYSKMDCQAFVEKCLEDIGISRNLAGSNAWYRAMTWTGSPEECVKTFGKIPPGAFLFILKDDGNEPERYKADGIGNASHIGIYTAIGLNAINSSATNKGVCESKFKGKSIRGGWNRVGLWDAIDYGFCLEEGDVMAEKAMVYGGNLKYPINLRKSPDGSLLDSIPQNSEVEMLGCQNGWIEVRFKNFNGWVKAEFVHPVTEQPVSGEDITVNRQKLLDIYTAVGELLGIHG